MDLDITLDWRETKSDDSGQTLLSASSSCSSESGLQASIDCALQRAIELMAVNVRDESRYFICEWNAEKNLLSIVVTDESKRVESPVTLELLLTGIAEMHQEKRLDLLKFWMTDYLSSSSDFLRFSVIAIFHTGDRSRGTLL